MPVTKERKLATTTTAPPTPGSPPDGGDPTERRKRLSLRRLLLGAAAVLLLAGLGGAGYWWFAVRTPPPPPPPKPGAVVTMEPISLNLADGHYLKIGIALQLVYSAGEGKGGTKGPDGSQALDLLIKTFTGRTMAELNDPARRDALTDDLQLAVEEAYHGEVMDVFLTEFVMQ
jgi:flagellar FliL protein